MKYENTGFCRILQRRNNIIVETLPRGKQELTHWGRDKMDAIFQTTFQMDFIERKRMNSN